MKLSLKDTRFPFDYEISQDLRGDSHLNDRDEKSKAFHEFEDFFFNGPSAEPLFQLYTVIDQIVGALNSDEKKSAERILMDALEKGIDKRWLYALVALRLDDSDESYQFLLRLFQREEDVSNKIEISYTLMQFNEQAPVLEFLGEVLASDAARILKMNAMGSLSWANLTEFEDPSSEELFQSILFSSITDSISDIRLYAYDGLMTHLRVLKFTPIDDPIEKILANEQDGTDYRTAVELLRERIDSIQVMDFSRSIIVESLKELPHNPPTIVLSECPTCSKIPETIEVDVVEGESIGPYTSSLETILFMDYPLDSIKRCPICGRLYVYKVYMKYEVHAIRDYHNEWLIRSDTKGVLEFLDSILETYPFKKIIRCGIFLKLDS